MRIKLFVSCISLLILNTIHAQTVIFSEDWTGGGTGWTLNVVTGPEGADPNFWMISDDEGGVLPGGCGVANNGNNTLYVTSVFNPSGGASYDAGGLCGFLFCPQSDRRTESPVINCTGQSNLTLNFNYIENGDGTNDNATVWYNDGTGWTLLNDPAKTATCGGGQGKWTAYSFALPASANNNPNVQIAFRWVNNDDGVGTDPSFAVDEITITTPVAAVLPVVSISPSPNDSLCVNSTLTLNGSATNGPITAWAWTVSPNAGVAFNPDTAAQNPTVTFTTPGTYTFTLQATNGSGNGDTTQVITILPASVPSVTITASPSNPICAGTTVNFTATPTNGGATPVYQWQVNGVTAGSNSPNFSSSALNNNDVITVTMTPSDTCVSPAAASDSYTVQVNPVVVPSVTIAASTTTTCASGTVSFTATPNNGGITPSYQWQVNGVNVGSNSPNYSSGSLNNGDTVQVVLTSSDPCATPATAASNTITIAITAAVAPSVTVVASATTACAGTSITFTATPTNGGTTPAYQWQVNGVNAGSNSPNFSSSTLSNNDTISVILTSSDPCASPATDTSNTIVIAITPTVVPSVTITASPANPICAGTTVNFTATPTNGGTTPTYQWQVNGANVGANSANYSSSTLNNSDTISVILTSTVACATPASDTDSYVIQVNPILVPSVTITPSGTITVCMGDSIVFTANPTNGGTNPIYHWLVNGSTANGSSTFTVYPPLTGTNFVSVILLSNATCASPTTATSNQVIVNANPLPTLSVSQQTTTICPNLPDTLLATATAGSTFTWSPAGGLNSTTNDTAVANNAATGTYTYYVTATLNGCSRTDSVQIIVANTFTASTGPAQTICLGDSAFLSVTGGTSWTWMPSGSLSCSTCATPVASPTTTTSYSVIASLAGCVDTVTQTITVVPNASASFNTTVISQGLPQLIGFSNSSINANSFYWTLGNGNTSVMQTPAGQYYNVAGTYTVVLIAYGSNGCNDTISTVLAVNDTVGLTVPNIFTPNGDEINDVWQPSAHGATSFECVIFNRWGIQVYEFLNAQDKWDGHTTAGIACNEGTYYYILKATDSNNKSYNLKGYIQLIR